MTGALIAAGASPVEIVADGSLLLAVPIAMVAGLVSFLSPCVLPLAPGYLAYVTGLTGSDIAALPVQREAATAGVPQPATVGGAGTSGAVSANGPSPAPTGAGAPDATGYDEPTPLRRSRVVLGAALFVAGFSAVFVSYGLLFGQLGTWLLIHQRAITVGLGAVVVLLGLGFLGLPLISATFWWNRERRSGYRPPTGLWGAPLLGVVFALGWTPCIGPTLAAVQSLAFTEASAARGALLSLAYCVGLGIPFLLIALGLRSAAGALRWTREHNRAITRAGGAMLVAVGILLLTGLWGELVIWLQTLAPGFTVSV